MEKEKKSLEKGMKFDFGKLRFDLIPPEALMFVAAIYTGGAFKYEDRNYEKGMLWSRPFAALMRHAWRWWLGKITGRSTDPESGMSHMAHVAWNALTCLQYEMTHPEFDDRPSTKHKTKLFETIYTALEQWAENVEKEKKGGKKEVK